MIERIERLQRRETVERGHRSVADGAGPPWLAACGPIKSTSFGLNADRSGEVGPVGR
jgi:hypothetical protein